MPYRYDDNRLEKLPQIQKSGRVCVLTTAHALRIRYSHPPNASLPHDFRIICVAKRLIKSSPPPLKCSLSYRGGIGWLIRTWLRDQQAYCARSSLSSNLSSFRARHYICYSQSINRACTHNEKIRLP